MYPFPSNIVSSSPLARDAVFMAASGHIEIKVLFDNNSAGETFRQLDFSIDSPAITAHLADNTGLIDVKEGDTVTVEGEEETFEIRRIAKTSIGIRYFELVYG